MATKLTLRLDEKLIESAKAYARRQGKSVSQLVAEFFERLGRQDDEPRNDDELTPKVRRLLGIIRESRDDENEYKRYIEDKHE